MLPNDQATRNLDDNFCLVHITHSYECTWRQWPNCMKTAKTFLKHVVHSVADGINIKWACEAGRKSADNSCLDLNLDRKWADISPHAVLQTHSLSITKNLFNQPKKKKDYSNFKYCMFLNYITIYTKIQFGLVRNSFFGTVGLAVVIKELGQGKFINSTFYNQCDLKK